MDGVGECIRLLQRFQEGELAIEEFRRSFLKVAERWPILPPELSRPLERAFFAIETYDRTESPETETALSISEETMRREMALAWEELERVPSEFRPRS